MERQPIPSINTKRYTQNVLYNVQDMAEILVKFFEKIKNLLNQLMQQNSEVLNTITMPVSKIN